MQGTAMDLNADVGEGSGPATTDDDKRLIRHLSSASVACGLHAGDPAVMDATIALCARAGVAVGAHPGYADRASFGRRDRSLPPGEVETLVLYQVGALDALCRRHGVEMQHVKPHGALYNQAAADPILAAAIARGVARFSRSLLLYGLATSEVMTAAAADAGLRFVPEAFADRGYLPDGSLQPRSVAGAVITDPAAAAAQAMGIARDGVVTAVDGTSVRLRAETICVHGDTPGAAGIAEVVRDALRAAAVDVASPTAGAGGARE